MLETQDRILQSHTKKGLLIKHSLPTRAELHPQGRVADHDEHGGGKLVIGEVRDRVDRL